MHSNKIKIDHCIYCKSTENLSDEHPIPFALNGRFVLEKASCESCRVATQKFEQAVLRDSLGSVREVLGLSSRKAKKQGRWTGTRPVFTSAGEKIATPDIQDTSVALVMSFGNYAPRRFHNEKLSQIHQQQTIFSHQITGLNIEKLAKLRPGLAKQELVSEAVTVNKVSFSKLAAKIAYSMYIFDCDSSFHSPELCDFIINGDEDSSEFVGGEDGEIVEKSLVRYNMKFQRRSGRGSMLWSKIQLFGCYGGPVYWVWLGEFDVTPDKIETLNKSKLRRIASNCGKAVVHPLKRKI